MSARRTMVRLGCAGGAVAALMVVACSEERDFDDRDTAGGEAGADTTPTDGGARPQGGGPSSSHDAGDTSVGLGGGGASSEGGFECEEGTFDCNEDASDGCEASDAPELETPTILAPVRGAYTGSLHAPASAATLRPRVTYSTQEESCGTLRYEIQFDDSCTPGDLEDCAFDSVENEGTSDTDSYQPAEDLPVSTDVPVGALYAWRVRACDASQRCSDWSAPAHLHVGRTRQDINGDGYADILGQSDVGTEVYFGGATFNGKADARLPLAVNARPRFIGDVNADGFADIAGMIAGYDPCTGYGTVVSVVYGSEAPTTADTQVLCRTAGSPSVITTVAEVGDMDADGFDDLAVGWGFNDTESSIQVFPGGESVGEEPMAEPEAPVKGVSYAFTFSDHQLISGRGDYNRDGYADLVAATNGTSTEPVRIHVLAGAKQVASSFLETIIDEPCGQPQWLSDATDFDGDGASDWALVCSGKTAQTRRFGILLGGTKSAGALSNVWTTALPLLTTTPFLNFDGDDTAELLISITGENAAIWQPGVSNPQAPARYMRYPENTYVDTADHNGDGRLDVVFGSYDRTPARAGSSTSFNVVPTNLTKPADAERDVQLAF